jgi:hypothetical protein
MSDWRKNIEVQRLTAELRQAEHDRDHYKAGYYRLCALVDRLSEVVHAEPEWNTDDQWDD